MVAMARALAQRQSRCHINLIRLALKKKTRLFGTMIPLAIFWLSHTPTHTYIHTPYIRIYTSRSYAFTYDENDFLQGLQVSVRTTII